MVFLVENGNEVQSHLVNAVHLSGGVTIRDAKPEDAFAIHQVLRNAFEPMISRGYSRIAVKSAVVKPWQIRKRIISGLTVLAAEDGPDIIGTITGIKGRKTMEALSFAVQPEFQNRGIGTELLTLLENLAIDEDCNKIYALTAWPMIEASRLYLNLGYVQEGYLRYHYHGEDLIVFSKHFSQEEDYAQWSSSTQEYETIQYSWPYWLF